MILIQKIRDSILMFSLVSSKFLAMRNISLYSVTLKVNICSAMYSQDRQTSGQVVYRMMLLDIRLYVPR